MSKKKKKSNVGIAASAAVVGVLLGAVSMISLGSSSTADVAYRNPYGLDYQQFQKRTVRDTYYNKRAPIPRFVVPEKEEEQVHEAAKEEMVGVTLGCLIRLSIIEELRAAVFANVPMDRNIQTAGALIQVFEDAAADCEELMIEMEEMMEYDMVEEETEVRRAALECLEPGFCDMFSRKRRSQCIGAQRSGACYRPGQTFLGQ